MAYVPKLLEDKKTVINKELLDYMQDGISGAYFTTDRTLKKEAQVLSVSLATANDRTLPITAAEVDTVVGNIEVLLNTI
jgi:hypothetical protein